MNVHSDNFVNILKNLRQRQVRRPRRKLNTSVRFERLEERLVLSTLDLTAGVLSYAAASGSANDVTYRFDSATNNDVLSDSGDTIVLTANAIAAGITVDAGHHTATIPDGPVGSIIMNTGNGDDTFHILSMIEPLSIGPTNNSGGTQTVYLGNATHGTQDISNNVFISNSLGTTTLNVDDSTNTVSARNVTISGTAISGMLSAGSINVTSGAVSNLGFHGGTASNGFTFTGTLAPSTTLNPGSGSTTTTVKQLSASTTLSITASIDAITIGNSGSTAGVTGRVDVTNTGTSTLTIDDSADSSARAVSMDSTATTGFNDTENYTYNALSSLTVKGGSGGNTITVFGTVPGVSNVLNPGTAANTIYVVGTNANSSLAINRGPGADTIVIGNDATGTLGLTSGILGTSMAISQASGFKASVVIDDSNDTTGQTAILSSATVTGLLGNPTGTVSYSPGEVISLQVKGGNGKNSFEVNNTGSGISPTSITSGPNDDSFIFEDGATLGGGTIDGGDGIDTLDYSAYTSAVVVDLSGSPQIATGTGGTSNIENVSAGSGTNTLTAPLGVASTLMGGPGNDTFIIPAGAGDVTVDGNGGTDNLHIAAAPTGDTFNQVVIGGTTQTTIVDGSTHTVTSTGINTIELNGGAGDTFATIDFSGGNPIPAGGETFTGGGGTNNSLNLVNDLPGGAPSFNQETYNATGPGTGGINLDGSQIQFSGLTPVLDTVSATNYVFNAPSSLNSISLTPTTANGFAATLIASTDRLPSFESVAFANKQNVTINSVSGSGASVTLNDGGTTDGLSTLNINTGDGEDFINLLLTPAGVLLIVNSAGGTDTFNVNAAGLGSTTTLLGSTATNILTYDAGGATTAQVGSTLKSGTDPNLIYDNMTTIHVINLADLPLTNTPATIAVQEGTLFNGVVGSFAVSNPSPILNQVNAVEVAGDFVASIDWGDGTSFAGIVVANGTGGFDVLGSHVYASKSTPTITVSATHHASSSTSTLNGITTSCQTDGGATSTITSPATVSDAPLSSSGVDILGVEGTAIPAGTLVARFADANPAGDVADFTATIDWGDGTASPGTITAAGGLVSGFLVTSIAPHTYAEEGTYAVQVTITDVGMSRTTADSLATIRDAALTATGTAVAAVEGTLFTGQVATFTDANPAGTISDFAVAVNWGDWIITPGTVTQPGGVGTAFVVTSAHTYKFGSYPITVSIKDSGGSTATATSTATVNGAALTPGTAAVLAGTEGQPLSTVVGSFTSGNPLAKAEDYTASITWGDGTTLSTATVAQAPNGTFYVSASHTYAEETGETLNAIVVTVKSSAGIVATLNATATIADAPLSATGQPMAAVEGTASPLTVANFVDADPNGTPSDYTVLINWGDGTTSTGAAVTVASSGGSTNGSNFSVTANHTYADEGTYIVTTTIADEGVSTATATSITAVSVSDPGPTPTPTAPVLSWGQLSPQSTTGLVPGVTMVATPTFVGGATPGDVVEVFETPGGSSAAPVLIATGVANSAGAWAATVAGSPMADGSYQITATASNSGGASASKSLGTVVIDTVSPVITNVVFNRQRGEMDVYFQDGLSGINLTDLSNGANYQISANPLNNSIAVRKTIIPTSVTVIPAATATGVDEVIVTFNHGKPLRVGHYTFQVTGAGIHDVSGNMLSGQFYGSYPTGGTDPGSNYVAQITAYPRRTLGAFPIKSGYAKPKSIPAIRSQAQVEVTARSRSLHVVLSGTGHAVHWPYQGQAILVDQAIASLAGIKPKRRGR
jgi:hypothetical protein